MKWAHVDIAGTMESTRGTPYLEKGMTGTSVRCVYMSLFSFVFGMLFLSRFSGLLFRCARRRCSSSLSSSRFCCDRLVASCTIFTNGVSVLFFSSTGD